MTPAQQEAARRAEVMLAFSRGEAIECRPQGFGYAWTEVAEPSWEWGGNEYRAKRTPIEIRVAFELDTTGALIVSRVTGYLNPEEVHRRINAGETELLLTVREVL